MSQLNSLDYRLRERRERELATMAISPIVVAVHRDMAAYYGAQIQQAAPDTRASHMPSASV